MRFSLIYFVFGVLLTTVSTSAETMLVARCFDKKPGTHFKACHYDELQAFVDCGRKKQTVLPMEDHEGLAFQIPLEDFIRCNPKLKEQIGRDFFDRYNARGRVLEWVNILQRHNIQSILNLDLEKLKNSLTPGHEQEITIKQVLGLSFLKVQKEKSNLSNKQLLSVDVRHAALNIRETNTIYFNSTGEIASEIMRSAILRDAQIDRYNYIKELEHDLVAMMLIHEACGILSCFDHNYQTSLSLWFTVQAVKKFNHPNASVNGHRILTDKTNSSSSVVNLNHWHSFNPFKKSLNQAMSGGGYNGSGGGDYGQLAFKMLLLEYLVPKSFSHSSNDRKVFKKILNLNVKTYDSNQSFFEKDRNIYARRQLFQRYLSIPAEWFHIYDLKKAATEIYNYIEMTGL